MKAKILLVCLLAIPLFSQTRIVIVDKGTVEISGKKYTGCKLVYECPKKLKVKNMNFNEACENQGSKLTVTGKDDKGDSVQKVWTGKLPKVKHEKPKDEKAVEKSDDTVLK